MAEQATAVTAPSGSQAPTMGATARLAVVARRLRWFVERREIAIFLVAVALFLYFWTSTTAFASYNNFVTLSQFLAPIAVIGAGEAVLLTAGEVDLSAGTAFVFFPFVVYFLWANAGLPLVAAILISLLTAACFGAINGLLTTLLQLPSFVTTLGTLFALDGVMLITSNGVQETMSLSGTGGNVLGNYAWSEVLWALAFTAAVYLVLHHTRFGSHVTATGGNLLGAAEAGLPVRRVKIWCFTLVSFVSAFAGIVDAIRITTLDPGNDGTTEMFYAIAAAVIGGTSLMGGRGTIIGAAIGAVVLGILFDGLYIKGVSAYYFQLVLGVAILGAMAANVQLRRATVRRWRRLRR
jgi:simple sugar transport system permease protein